MSRKPSKSRDPKPSRPTLGARLAGFSPALPFVAVVFVILVAIAGLERLKQRVLDSTEYSRSLKLQFLYNEGENWVEKEHWIDWIASAVSLPENQSLMDSDLVKDVARRLEESGWVRRVESVVRKTDGTVQVLCDYRRPIAMIAVPSKDGIRYRPVDRERYCLPVEFGKEKASKSGYVLIEGVRSSPPPLGQAYGQGTTKDEDAVAAIGHAADLFEQPEIATRLESIDYANYGGRRNKRETHVLLVTRNRDGGKAHVVEWGSAPGREIEEPPKADKLRNLLLLAKRNFPDPVADVSVYRTGAIVRR